MKTNIRKRIFLLIAAVLLCTGLAFAADTLKSYDKTVPLIVGPYREAVFVLLGLFFVISLVFAFRPVNGMTLSGAGCIAISVLWFTAEKLLAYRTPGSIWLERMSHWFPLPLILFGIGAALWIRAFSGKDTGKSIFSERKQLLLALLLMFIVLQPVLKGGFYWDDAFFSVEAQNMRLSGTSIWERVWKEIVDYVRIGRINPFATFHFLVFYYIPDVRLYKLMLVVLTLLDGWLFYHFLCLWTKEQKAAILSLLAATLCFQHRLYHDPLNSYYGLMQVMFAELMGALIFYVRWLRERKTGFAVLSLLFFAMGLMSYEMFFPLTALFLIPAWEQEKHPLKAIRRMIPWVLLAVGLFALSMLLRRNITDETAYGGTTFSLDIPLILKTFATQVGSALPLSYRDAGYDTGMMGTLVQWHTIFNTSLAEFLRSIQWQDLLGCLILVFLLREFSSERMKFSGFHLLFGFLLWLLPGLVISLSEKYQLDMGPGLAYIPILFSYFGMGLILYELSAFAGKVLNFHALRVVLSGAGCMILLLTLQDNRHISNMLDDIFLYPRKAGEEALRSGILDDFDSGTVLSAVPYSLWEHGWLREPYQDVFYSLNARRQLHAVGVWDYVASFDKEKTAWVTPNDMMLITYGGDALGGFAKCGSLNGTGFDYEGRKLKDPMVSDVFVYLSGRNRDNTSLIYETRDAEWKQLQLKDAWLIRETLDGALYKIQEKRPILFDTIGIVRY